MSFLNIMMVHHYIEITEIERLQMVSSLVHSSLVVHCSYRLKVYEGQLPIQLPSS